MNYNTMYTEICEETGLTRQEIYYFAQWCAYKYNDDDFDDEGNFINGDR